MDEIEQRLREASEACIKSYGDWRKNEKDSTGRESLQDSVHELRKVASRLEIEIAVSERGEMGNKPIPIPSHRASRENKGNSAEGNDILSAEDMQDQPGQNNGRSGGARRGGGNRRGRLSKKAEG